MSDTETGFVISASVPSLTIAALTTLFSQAEQAASQEFFCRTISSRKTEEIIVPLADEDLPTWPAQALRILPGETLCVTGKLDETGELVHLQVVPEAGERGARVIKLELTRGERTTLSVRHSSTDVLDYRALTVQTRAAVTMPTRTVHVFPRVRNTEQWQRSVRELILFRFRFLPPLGPRSCVYRASVPRSPSADVASRIITGTFAFSIGERLIRTPELDAELGRLGFAPMPTTSWVGGLDLDGSLWRARLGLAFGVGGVSTRRRETGAKLSATLGHVQLTAGFDALRYRNFTFFGSTGVAYGTRALDVNTETLAPFAERLRTKAETVAWRYLAVPVEIGIDHLTPLRRDGASSWWAWMFGARLAWMHQLEGKWTEINHGKEDSHDLDGGPQLDVSGPAARVVIGIGAFSEPR